MTDERWEDLKGRLADDKKVEEHTTEDLEGRPGTIESIIVNSPLGRIRVSRTSEPKKLSEKAFYSKRGGSTMSVQPKYDETEQIHIFMVEKQDAMGRWTQIDASAFM